MCKVWLSLRYSSVGVMLAGVGSAITGCTAEDAVKALLIWLALALGSGAGTTPDTGDSTPAAPTDIVLYDGGQHNGNLGGRAGADAICLDAATGTAADSGRTHHIAFLSVSSSDDLSNLNEFPDLDTDAPLVSLTGATVSSTFISAFDGAIDVSLAAAGVLGGGAWWSGSGASGIAAETCKGWSSQSTDDSAVIGVSSSEFNWIDGTTTFPCSMSSIHVLCVAY